MQGVSSRTRSRSATRFQSLDDMIPYKRRKKVLKNNQRKKSKHVVIDVENGNTSDEREDSVVSNDKGGNFFKDDCGLEAEKPIVIDSDADSASDDDNDNDDHRGDDGDDHDDDGNGLFSSSDEKGSSDEDGDGCGLVAEKPIVIDSEGGSASDDDHRGDDGDDHDDDGDVSVGDEDHGGDDDDDVSGGDDDGLCSSSDEKGTSDEDFEGSESSSSEESYSSYGDEMEDEGEEEEDEEEVVVRKVKSESSEMRKRTKDDVSERDYEEVEEGDFEKSPSSSVNNTEYGVENQEELKHAECATASVSYNSLENLKLDSHKVDTRPPACGETLPLIWTLAEKSEALEKISKDEELEELWEEFDMSLEEEEEIDSLIGNIGANEATPKNMTSPTSLCEHDFYLDDDGDVSVGDDDHGDDDDEDDDDDDDVSGGDDDGLCSSSDEDFEGSECSSSEEEEEEEEEEEVMVRKVKSEKGGETLPLIWSLAEKSKPLEKSKVDEEVEELWKQMDISLKEIDSMMGNIEANEATPKNMRSPTSSLCEHEEGCSEKKSCIEKESCVDSSKLHEGAEKIEVESDDDVEVIDEITMPSEVKAQKNKKKKEYRLRSRQNVAPVLEELGDSTRVHKSQRKNVNANEKANDSVKLDFHESKVHNVRGNAWKGRKYDGDHNVKMVRQFKPKELRQHLMNLLGECYLDEKNSKKREWIELKEKDGCDVHKVDTRPPACRKTLPSLWSLEEKSKPLEKSETEMELDELWEQMTIHLEEAVAIDNIGASEATPKDKGSQTSDCDHNLYLDEEIGLYCNRCGLVMTEIKNISPPVVDRFSYEGSGNRMSFSEVKGSPIDESQFKYHDGDSEAVLSHKEGTVWDFIPDVKQSLYPHQREGFEFIWKNLAGTIDLDQLGSPDRFTERGCIISHYPGTGKTRLTIMFLKTYLKVFPECHPVIVAPPGLLLTWEVEFKKWDIGVPFHNLNNPELSGKERDDVVNLLDRSSNLQRDTEALRIVKMLSWYKEKSILGISYNLYVKLAGSDDGKEDYGSKMMEEEKSGIMGKFLRECPGLLVLDEGHIPRTEKSGKWKALVKDVQTKKRILLSGTPFQNNFVELKHTLTLVKRSFLNTIPQELKKFFRNRQMPKEKPSEGWSWEPISSGNTAGNLANDKISQLKSQIDSFVHVDSGSILKKKLPGLRKCMLTLKPNSFQKEILDSIESSQKTVKFEHKVALVSVHPSLFLDCTHLTKKEDSVLDKERLKTLRLKPYEGVKTKFLVEFVRLCVAVKERVLVFSQFIDPLVLIIDQLESVFKWSLGKEILYMSGTVNRDTKESQIQTFNNPNSEAKIMLASTKACNEGISLVGASRVVLLDVVWNPSVERQAIGRAYRLGQKKIVYAYNLITEGTAERTKYCKQAEKDRLSELVFSDKNAAENDEPKSGAVDFEDRVLDHMIRHENLKDMFGERVVEP